jgi:predicted amino acid racemase
MTAPRLEIDLRKIRHNATTLVNRLSKRSISVTGITKAARGNPDIATALLQGGVRTLGDSRIENIEALRRAGITAPMVLIRSPMMSQADRVVASADLSLNTERDVIGKLDDAARKSQRTHRIVLMVELGDLREGIMPGDLADVVQQTLRFPNIALKGIGTNLACRNGVIPDNRNMTELSALADSIDARFGPDIGAKLGIISGGNSANLSWALGTADTGRVNDLRLGEALLLGVDPLHRQAIDGLYTDAITLITEVIESKIKPSQPWGEIAQAAFGDAPTATDRGSISQTIVAIGRQDTDPDGLAPPSGMAIIGSSGDHLVLDTGKRDITVGTEIRFQLNYSALMRTMNAPFVAQTIRSPSDELTAAVEPTAPPCVMPPQTPMRERKQP